MATPIAEHFMFSPDPVLAADYALQGEECPELCGDSECRSHHRGSLMLRILLRRMREKAQIEMARSGDPVVASGGRGRRGESYW